MLFTDRLALKLKPNLPLILQTEAAECGLACLAMVAGYYGYKTDLPSLRKDYSISLKGMTLSALIQIAAKLKLSSRPVKLEIDELRELRVPCILHWNLNHFVVLRAVTSKEVTIHDPASGIRSLSWSEVSSSFTGIALEIWTGSDFQPRQVQQTIQLRSLMGHVRGMVPSCGQLFTLAIALELFALLTPFYLQWVIDFVLVSADRDLLTTLALAFGLLMLIQQALIAGRSWVLLYFSTTLGVQWRANVFLHLIRLPVQYFEKRHLGDIVSRFGATEIIQKTLTVSFVEGILDGLMTVATLTLMLIYSPILTLIALVAMLLYAVVRWIWFAPFRNANAEQIIHTAKQESHFLETVRGIKAIKLFQRQTLRQANWLSLLIEQVNSELRTEKLILFYRLLNGLLFGIENILIIWVGANLVLDGRFSVGAFTAFIAYKENFGGRVTGLVDKFFELRMLRLHGERLADVVLVEPEKIADSEQVKYCNESAPSISIRGLRFRYSDGEPYVLDSISFDVQSGGAVAIVGPSGCGKTTLLNILLGVLPFSEGEILINGINIKKFGIDNLRKMVGTVLQDDVLFAGSIADNISFFDSAPDQVLIRRCAELAAIAEDIEKMPMGYNTLVGDMGTVLSGGQKQRILLARALYKRPAVLFLDEATSHLDVVKEATVNKSIRSLNITRIIIAHRKETICSAEKIVRLNAGRVEYEGPVEAACSPGGSMLSADAFI